MQRGEGPRRSSPSRHIPCTSAARCSRGADVASLPLRARRTRWLPDLDAIDDETWERCAIFWLNYPHNPTGAVAPLSFLEELAERARTHGFFLASDEAYTELWFDEPPASAVQLADRTNVVVFQTLSKRSSMTGYRSGFVCGERRARRRAALVPAERGNGAAGVRPARVGRRVERRGARRGDARALPREAGRCSHRCSSSRRASSDATFYLWFRVPAGESSEAFATRLLEHGVVVSPGAVLRPVAARATSASRSCRPLEECERAATILRSVL